MLAALTPDSVITGLLFQYRLTCEGIVKSLAPQVLDSNECNEVEDGRIQLIEARHARQASRQHLRGCECVTLMALPGNASMPHLPKRRNGRHSVRECLKMQRDATLRWRRLPIFETVEVCVATLMQNATCKSLTLI